MYQNVSSEKRLIFCITSFLLREEKRSPRVSFSAHLRSFPHRRVSSIMESFCMEIFFPEISSCTKRFSRRRRRCTAVSPWVMMRLVASLAEKTSLFASSQSCSVLKSVIIRVRRDTPRPFSSFFFALVSASSRIMPLQEILSQISEASPVCFSALESAVSHRFIVPQIILAV